MSQFRVEKRPLECLILFSDGSRMEGTLFLSPFAPLRSGPQTVADLMAEDDRVLPCRGSDGRFLLVGKAVVAAIRVPPSELDTQDFLVRLPARLRLTGSHALSGHLLADEGAGERLTDLLNTRDAWCRLEDQGAVYWVSKKHLITVEAEEA